MPGGRRRRLAREEGRGVPGVVGDQRDVAERRGPQSRQRVQTVEDATVEVDQAVAFVTGLARLQGEDQELLLVEAELDFLQVVESAKEETRAAIKTRR